jgi:predicted membrane chloride channel (bestrophin family)
MSAVLKKLKSFAIRKSLPNTDRLMASIKKENENNSSWFGWYKNGVTYEKTLDGQRGSILGYDEAYITSIGSMIPRDGSVLNWKEGILVIALSCGVCWILGYFSCMNNPDVNASNCVALPQPSTGFLTLLTLCSFVIAFFINMVVQRWWAVRTCIGGVSGACIECMMNLSVIITTTVENKSENAEEYERFEKLGKYFLKRFAGMLILSYHLMINMARSENDIGHLLKRGIITEKEYAYFTSFSSGVPDACTIMIKFLHEAASLGLLEQSSRISETNMNILTKSVGAIRSNVGGLSTYLNVQLPFPFIQMVCLICYCFMLQLILVCSSFVAFGLSTNNSSYVVIGMMTIGIYNGVLIGMMKLFVVLCNPMGTDTADFPIMTYCNSLESKLFEMQDHAFDLDYVVDFNQVDDKGVLVRFPSKRKFDSKNNLASIGINIEDFDKV